MQKTSDADFKRFVRHCKKWQDKLGVKDWKVCYKHDNLDDAYARTYMDLTGAIATIVFGKEWDEFASRNDAFIKSTALHEVLHIVMRPLVAEAEDRFTTQSALDIAEHRIIRQLEKIMEGVL